VRDGFAGTALVDAFASNGFGLYNMTGNVWNGARTGTTLPPTGMARATIPAAGPRHTPRWGHHAQWVNAIGTTSVDATRSPNERDDGNESLRR